MKTSSLTRIILALAFMMGFGFNANAQFFKKLAKKAEKAAERTVERRVERETAEKTDQALDSILEPGSGGKKSPDTSGGGSDSGNGSSNGSGGSTGSESSAGNSPSSNKSIAVYSKFDYVPGDKQLFFDDFGNDFIGDFPSKWNTNAGGEVVTLGDSPQKWLGLKSGYNIYYIPDAPQLPKEYTVEFDIAGVGIDNKTSSNTKLAVYLSEDAKFDQGRNYAYAEIPFCQYSPIGITIQNSIAGKREIRTTVKADIRNQIAQNNVHVSIAVNDQRFRLWVNEVKYIDVPRLMPPNGAVTTLKFHPNGFKDGKEQVFITNLKVAEGGVDLRRKLISEGKISTNGILFDSGSDNIQPQSMGIIRQISQVLTQEKSMRLKIVGHTDADGSEESNMRLSKNRAEAVINALVSIYGIDSGRLESEGKGESDPVGDNSTPDGKAQNRRVEFIKQ